MFSRGDLLRPYLNGEPRYDKPILTQRLQALSVLAFGVDETALRLPSAMCAVAWVLVILAFMRRAFGVERALLAAAVAAGSVGPCVVVARVREQDPWSRRMAWHAQSSVH